MGIRFTGISTPIGGLEWEYTEKKEHPSELLIYPGQKIQVFISSICGKEKYDRVRSELKRHIEATGLAVVYLFEGTGASTVAAGAHYLYALEDSDVCIFLIDNADGISPGVQEEIDMVKRNNIKALYYFCDETQKEKTPLEKSLRGSQFAKSKTIHQFSELMQNGAQDLLDDIISVYHHYCKNRFNLRNATEAEDIQQVEFIRGRDIQTLTMPKTVLKNIDKSTDYYLKYALGYSGIRIPGEEEKTGEMDEWCIQFLPVLFEGKTIKQFNVALFLEALKKNQTDCYSSLVAVRWEAIQAYFMGDVDSCIKHLEKALALARELKQPSWVINDILIDLRNQQIVLDAINNRFAILSQRIHRLLNRGQICLSILRKEVNIGVFAVPDHLFDDGAQQAAFFLQRGRIHRAGEGFDHLLMEGELLMQHPALLGEGFQFGKAQLLHLALLMERIDLLHDVFRGGVAGNGQGIHQSPDFILRFGVLFPEQRKLCVVALLAATDDLLGLRQQPGKGFLVGGQLADLLDDLGVQRVAVAVLHGADGTVAALLGGAHVGVDQLTVRRAAVGQFRAHIVAAFAAP